MTSEKSTSYVKVSKNNNNSEIFILSRNNLLYENVV